MRALPTLARRALAVAAVLLMLAGGLRAQQPELLVYDWDLGPSPAANIALVQALGFDGLVTRVRDQGDLAKLAAYARQASALDGFRTLAYVAYDFAKPAQADVWRNALPILADADAPLWVLVRNAPDLDAVRELLGEIARTAQGSGVRAVVYPHWTTDIETAAEAAAVIADVGHPNLRNSLHTCHEIRGGNQDVLDVVAAEHAGGSALVAIAGAAEDAYAGPPSPFVTWADAIKPLDEGGFSLAPFLQALHDAGYEGPVVLQTFGIGGDLAHLRRSLGAYYGYVAELER